VNLSSFTSFWDDERKTDGAEGKKSQGALSKVMEHLMELFGSSGRAGPESWTPLAGAARRKNGGLRGGGVSENWFTDSKALYSLYGAKVGQAAVAAGRVGHFGGEC